MAKKFSAIHGFHEVFELSGDTYDLTSVLQEKQTYINHNTICFITADAGDNGKYAANHLINEGDKFIVVQNDVFALVGTSENFGENTWRPLLIDGVQILDSTTEDKINLESTSEYLTIEGDYDETLHTLSVKYGFDIDAIIQYVQEHIEIPSPQIPGDGELQFEFEKSKVHTEAGGTSREIEIEQNTLGVKTTYIEEQEQEDPENEGETVTEEVEVEGNFSADTSDAHTVKIHYKGTADRVDWYVDQDTRDDDVRNESTAKKFVYIEPLNEYFQQAGFPAYSACIKQDIISEDSIVFITCGASDATTFQNPEYQTGARFIWTHGKMFSCNTWMPLFTRLTANDALNQLDPPIGRDNAGGRLIIQGAGGIVVDNTNSGTDKIITIDGSGVQGGGSGDRVVWTQIQESGTPIATINVNGESQVVYAPSDGGGSLTGEGHIYNQEKDSLAEGSNNDIKPINLASGKRAHAEGDNTNATSFSAHAEGGSTVASGGHSHAEGYNTESSGLYSHAEGEDTIASGQDSHAEGYNTESSYRYAHAEGANTQAQGIAAHTEGSKTVASANAAHAEGSRTEASGENAHAEGSHTQATAIHAHAEGLYSSATGKRSHAEGHHSNATGVESHAEGNHTNATAEGAHAEGYYVTASGKASHSEGCENTASGKASHTEGCENTASGKGTHAEGYNTESSGNYSHTEGTKTKTYGKSSHAEGCETVAGKQTPPTSPDTNYGNHAHAEGTKSKAEGQDSHAEGYETTASGKKSHAEGDTTKASGNISHAEGSNTEANGLQSHAEGWGTKANGKRSHAENNSTRAVGNSSHAEGYKTESSGMYSHAEGIGFESSSNYNLVLSNAAYEHSKYYSVLNVNSENTFDWGSLPFNNIGIYDSNNKLVGIIKERYYHNTGSLLYIYSINDGYPDSLDDVITGTYSARRISGKSIGETSHVEGKRCIATGEASHAEGEGTIAAGDHSHVCGRFNNEDIDSEFAFIVGNGTKEKSRRNAFAITWSGHLVLWDSNNNRVELEPDKLRQLIALV